MFELVGRVGVLTESNGEERLEVVDGSRLRVGDSVLEQVRGFVGTLTGVVGDISGHPDRSELTTDVRLPDDGSLSGEVMYVIHPSGAETTYLIGHVEPAGDGSRVALSGMPRFVWGQSEVVSGRRSQFESSVEQPKAAAYAGRRVRIGERVFTIRQMKRLTTFVTEEGFDSETVVGKRFEVFSTAVGDRFRIAM